MTKSTSSSRRQHHHQHSRSQRNNNDKSKNSGGTCNSSNNKTRRNTCSGRGGGGGGTCSTSSHKSNRSTNNRLPLVSNLLQDHNNIYNNNLMLLVATTIGIVYLSLYGNNTLLYTRNGSGNGGKGIVLPIHLSQESWIETSRIASEEMLHDWLGRGKQGTDSVTIRTMPVTTTDEDGYDDDDDDDSLSSNDNNSNNKKITAPTSTSSISTQAPTIRRSLFATRNITKGEVIVSIGYVDLEHEIMQDHPTLLPLVSKSLHYATQVATMKQEQHKQSDRQDTLSTSLTSNKLLAIIQFLFIVGKAQTNTKKVEPKWKSYIQSLPQNVTSMGWYWTKEEQRCLVSRPNSSFRRLQFDLRVYHTAISHLRKAFTPLQQILEGMSSSSNDNNSNKENEQKQLLEWVYLMWRTRGFGSRLLPILDFADHHALRAVPVFVTTKNGKASFVATQDIRAGDPVYNSYGDLSVFDMAEHYGFLPDSINDIVYFESPLIHEHFLSSPHTRNEQVCTTAGAAKFFGNVTSTTTSTRGSQHVVIEASLDQMKQSTYMKSFRPTESTYACIRVMLQSTNKQDILSYIQRTLEKDSQRYKDMIDAQHCTPPSSSLSDRAGNSGSNLPLIQKMNSMTAKLMDGTISVINEAIIATDNDSNNKKKTTEYPGIPHYIE